MASGDSVPNGTPMPQVHKRRGKHLTQAAHDRHRNAKLEDGRRQIATRSASLVADFVVDAERLDMSTLLTHCRAVMKLTAEAIEADEFWGEHFAIILTNAANEIR